MLQPDIRFDDAISCLRRGKVGITFGGSESLGYWINEIVFEGDVTIDYRPLPGAAGLTQQLKFMMKGVAKVGIAAKSMTTMFESIRAELDRMNFSHDPETWILIPLAKDDRIFKYLQVVRDNPRIRQMYTNNTPEEMMALCPVTIEWDD